MGTGPILNISEIQNSTDDGKSDHLLVIECQAEDVAPRPELSVSIDGTSINMSTILEDDDQDGVYSIYANTTLNAEGNEHSEVRCEIFFSDPSISHPPYIDMQTFVPAGYDPQFTTEVPEDATEPEAAPESLQNPSDDGVYIHYSWMLLAIAAVLSSIQSIL